MKLHFLKEDALAALKGNLDANLHHYKSADNGWIYEYFQGENPFGEFKLEVPDFQLTYDPNTELAVNDMANAKILHTALINLSDTQATDERFWSGLCHSDCWEYCRTRWHYDADKVNPTRDEIGNRYFFLQNKKRAVQLNTISKLWWTARLVYDPNRKDPYELLKYFENDYATKSLVILSNNYMSSPDVANGLIEALMVVQDQGLVLPGRRQEVFYEATRYLNVLGGTHILDYFTHEEIKARVIKHLKGMDGATYKVFSPIPEGPPSTEEIPDVAENPVIEANGHAQVTDSEPVTTPPVDGFVGTLVLHEPSIVPYTDDAFAFPGEDDFSFPGEDEPTQGGASFLNDEPTEETPQPDPIQVETAATTPSSDPIMVDDDGQIQVMFPETDLLAALHEGGFVYLDHRMTSGLIWVIYDADRIPEFKHICEKFGTKFKYEWRGAKATDNKPAWCISGQK